MQENIQSTLKSNDTEEWLDTVWTRPIGYQWARLFNHFDIHPNTVTIMSMIHLMEEDREWFFPVSRLWMP